VAAGDLVGAGLPVPKHLKRAAEEGIAGCGGVAGVSILVGPGACSGEWPPHVPGPQTVLCGDSGAGQFAPGEYLLKSGAFQSVGRAFGRLSEIHDAAAWLENAHDLGGGRLHLAGHHNLPGDDEIGEVVGIRQLGEVPEFHVDTGAQHSRRSELLPGDGHFFRLEADAIDLKIRTLRDLVGQAAVAAAQDYAVTALHAAAVHDGLCGALDEGGEPVVRIRCGGLRLVQGWLCHLFRTENVDVARGSADVESIAGE